MLRLVAATKTESEDHRMSRDDWFKNYNPVTLALGILFIAAGVWTITELVVHGVRTSIGGVVIVVLGVLVPLSLGLVIIQNQLRLRKNSN